MSRTQLSLALCVTLAAATAVAQSKDAKNETRNKSASFRAAP